MFKKIAIVGLGLIGGSLGMDIYRKKIAKEIIGISRKNTTLRQALKKKAIHKASTKLKDISQADLIIISTPVETILKILPKLFSYAKPGSITIDVGSTKERIVQTAQANLAMNKYFIGTHPLAGSEKRGIYFSQSNLFKGSLCILVPLETTPKGIVKKIKNFWHALGARTKILSAAYHDKALVFSSQFPHLLAFSLMRLIPPSFIEYVSSGFKDTTRIASSDPKLWQEIFLSNKDNLIKAIESFQDILELYKKLLRNQDRRRLLYLIKQAKRIRDEL